jgi:uncharacterized SAM-binding protein YcdF (DUF218 family)
MEKLLASLFNNLCLLLYPSVLLVLTVVIALIFWRKVLSRFLLVLALCYFYFSANGMIPKLLANYLESTQPINTKTIVAHHAMIVLGAGISHYPKKAQPGILAYPRILEAYRIYNIAKNHGIDYTIFLSGGMTNHHYHIAEATLYKHVLTQLGVPEQNLITEAQSLNTYKNAQNLKHIIKAYPFQHFLLVTSSSHMHRAQEYFRHFQINTIAAPSDYPYPDQSIFPLGYNLALQQIYMHEIIGIWRYHLYNFLGLNH